MCAQRRVVCIRLRMAKCAISEAVEFLANQIQAILLRRTSDPAPTQVLRLQLVQRRFDFPSLVVQRGQFFSRRLHVIEDGGDQSIARFGVSHTLKPILDHPDGYCVPLSLPVLHGRVETTEEGPVGQSFIRRQEKCFAHAPEQIRTG